jgi:hypothetical protein
MYMRIWAFKVYMGLYSVYTRAYEQLARPRARPIPRPSAAADADRAAVRSSAAIEARGHRELARKLMRRKRGGAPVNASTEVATSRSANAAGRRSAIAVRCLPRRPACVNVHNLQIFRRKTLQQVQNRKRANKRDHKV